MPMRNLLMGFAISIALMLNSLTVDADNPEEALVLHFPFSEGEGMVAEDTSPNGFEANLQGDYKWVAQGKVGSALELTAGVAIVPDDDRLDVEQITAMAWIFPTSITPENTGEHWTGSNMIYDKSGNSDDSVALALMEDDGAYLYINSGPGGGNRMGPFDGADVNNTLSLPDAGVQTNQWQHIAGVFDGVNIQIYLDGELAGEMPIPGDNPSIIWNDNNSEIGGRENSDIWFVGILDEFALFNRALTDDEIQQMMVSGLAVDPDGKLTTTWSNIKVK